MGSTANEDKRTYLYRQTTIDELQVKISALLNIEKVLKKINLGDFYMLI